MTDSNNVSLLHNAAHFGHYHLFPYLINELMMDHNAPNNDGLTPLSIAAIEGHLNIVSHLLHIERTVHYDRKSRTPMYYAAGAGHIHIVKYLMEYDPKMNTFVTNLTNSFVSPLIYAVGYGRPEVVKYLMDTAKCGPFIIYDNEITLLEIALQNWHEDIFEILICMCKQIKTLSDFQTSKLLYCLHCMASKGDLKIFKLLTEKFNLNLNCFNESGVKPIFEAVYSGHLNIVRYIVEDQKFNLDEIIERKSKAFSLHICAIQGHLHIVDYLLDTAKANLLIMVDMSNETPLHYAAEKGYFDVVKRLACTFEQYLFMVNNDGKTPLELAIERKCWMTMLLLIVMMFNVIRKL